jgi:hypothetical protein
LISEVDGDWALTINLANAYLSLGSAEANKSTSPSVVHAKSLIALVGPALKLIHNDVHINVMEWIVDTYSAYLSFSDPILLQSDLDALATTKAAELFPAEHNVISEMLGYTNAKTVSWMDYLDPFRTRMSFYVLMLLLCIQNNANF